MLTWTAGLHSTPQGRPHAGSHERASGADGGAHPRPQSLKARESEISNPLLLCVAGFVGGQAEPDSDSEIPDFNFTEPSEKDCPLCKEWDTLRCTELGRVLFSVKPYKWGHLMVVPNRHVATLALCSDEEACGLLRLVSEAASVCGATKTAGPCFLIIYCSCSRSFSCYKDTNELF